MLDPTPIAGDINYTAFGMDTFLLDRVGVDILSTLVNGYYEHAFTIHDVAIINLASAKTIIGQNYTGNVTMTVENQGNYTENFEAVLYANASAIGNQSYIELPSSYQALSTLQWNTTGYAFGNYTFSAIAAPVVGENDTADNSYTCVIQVHVGVPGDVSSIILGVYDRTVNMRDIQYIIMHFNTTPQSPNWNPNCDINNDGTVNMRDVQIAILNFNKHE
jgi:hypothetical protein